YRQAHLVFNRLDFKSNARFAGEIVRIGPTQHEAFERDAFQNFAGDIDFRLFAPGHMLPWRTFLPVGDIRESSPILTREFGFGDEIAGSAEVREATAAASRDFRTRQK